MQLGLITTSTTDVVIETNLVSPEDTKEVRKAVRCRTASVHMRTERYDIVSFQFLVHFSVSPNFWTCFGTDRLIFFRTRVNASPFRATFWNGPKWNGKIPCGQDLSFSYGPQFVRSIHPNCGPNIFPYGPHIRV